MCNCFDNFFKVTEFKDQLLFATGVKPERIVEFSCGMIPILPLILLLINIFCLVTAMFYFISLCHNVLSTICQFKLF